MAGVPGPKAGCLELPASLRPELVEDFLQKLYGQENVKIALTAESATGQEVGGFVHMTQVLATWARLDPSAPRRLEVPAGLQLSDEPDKSQFAASLPRMAALYFADQVRSGEITLTRNQGLRAVVPRVRAMQTEKFLDTTRGSGIVLCCFSGAHSEFIQPLYEYPRIHGVRDEGDFHTLLRKLLKQLGKRVENSVDEEQRAFIAKLIHQLFLNSDEHGSFDAYGEKLSKAIRGVVLRVIEIPDTEAFRGDTSLQSYLNRVKLTPRRDGTVQAANVTLLELSVFDSGPGLALRWLAEKEGKRKYEQFSVEQEIDAIRTCFRKHATTKANAYSGEGLSVAVQLMKKLNAFMTIRSGRVSLWQDFTFERRDDFAAKTRFPDRKLSEIAGTGYSIVFRVE